MSYTPPADPPPPPPTLQSQPFGEVMKPIAADAPSSYAELNDVTMQLLMAYPLMPNSKHITSTNNNVNGAIQNKDVKMIFSSSPPSQQAQQQQQTSTMPPPSSINNNLITNNNNNKRSKSSLLSSSLPSVSIDVTCVHPASLRPNSLTAHGKKRGRPKGSKDKIKRTIKKNVEKERQKRESTPTSHRGGPVRSSSDKARLTSANSHMQMSGHSMHSHANGNTKNAASAQAAAAAAAHDDDDDDDDDDNDDDDDDDGNN